MRIIKHNSEQIKFQYIRKEKENCHIGQKNYYLVKLNF